MKNVTQVVGLINDDKVPLELNLVGERVDAALIKLEEYLDNARLHNIKEVSVVHGYGSGALRNAIHTYLSKQKYVKDYHLDDINFNHHKLKGDAKDLVLKLCAKDPEDRIELEDVKKHKYFKGIDFNKVLKLTQPLDKYINDCKNTYISPNLE